MKIVVFDDDPTGSQTVHGCHLLFSWDVDLLCKGLRNPSPLLFILTNTRSMSPEAALLRNSEICQNLCEALQREGLDFHEVVVVSRGDSTLRGHGVLEPKVIEEELGPFAATLHVPAFLEGGRSTINGIHCLNGIPVHETAFAKDCLFGFSTSNLAEWLEEKSLGSIKQTDVLRITCKQLDEAASTELGRRNLVDFLRNLDRNQSVVVDAETSKQLSCLGDAIRSLLEDKRFLFRSAASFINALSEVDSKILELDSLQHFRRKNELGISLPGMVMVGSHVPLADIQLDELLAVDQCDGLELPVGELRRLFDGSSENFLLSELEKLWVNQLLQLIQGGKTPVLYTSREDIHFDLPEMQREFEQSLALLMSRLVTSISPKLGYLITKGGLTTQTFLVHGLQLKEVYLEGQLLPGLSLVRPTFNDELGTLPIITFPGNLGEKDTLLRSWCLMESCRYC